MKKLLFVINPISGGLDKNDILSELDGICASRNVDHYIYKTTGNNDKKKIQQSISEHQPDAVVACGGDGTVNLVAIAILGLKSDVKMGILPLGSANGMATELAIPEETGAALDVLFEGKILKLDVLCINNDHFCLHLADMGLNANLIKRFEEGPSRGKLGYARHFFETLFKKKPTKYTFKINGDEFRSRAEMVVFANARMYGTGAVVNPDGKLDDRKFEVCIFKPYPWHAIFKLTIQFFTGQLKQSTFVKIYSVEKVEVSTKKAEDLQVDGELTGSFSNVVAKIYPDPVNVIVPNE